MPGRGRRRDAALLAVASVLSGLLAYVFFSLVTRTLGATAAAPVSVLWTYWAAAAAVLTFPLQHWIARTVEAEGGELGVRHALPRVAGVVAVAALVAGTIAWLLRDPLFHRDDAVFPVLVALVTVGSGFVGLVRGQLSARLQFRSVGWALIGENGVRCVAAAALAVAGVDAPGAYGLALAVGPLIGLAWPSCLRVRRTGTPASDGSPVAFLGGVAGGNLIGQFVLTGGPVVLALLGGAPAEVTALFAGLALFRAPYTMGIGVVAPVTGYLTSLVATGREQALSRVRVVLVVGTVAAAAAAALVGWFVGPALVSAVFGSDVELSASEAAMIAIGSAFAVGNLLVTLGLIARGRGGSVLRCWVLACACGAAVLLVDATALTRVVTAFVGAEAIAFAAMGLAEARVGRSGLRPG